LKEEASHLKCVFGCIVACRESSSVSCTGPTSLTSLSLRKSEQFLPSPVRILRPQLPRVTPRASGALIVPRRVSPRFMTAGSRSARPFHQQSHGGRKVCAMYRNRHAHGDACHRATPWKIKSFQIDSHFLSLSLVSLSLLSSLSFPLSERGVSVLTDLQSSIDCQ
jgi:hypothetical protein